MGASLVELRICRRFHSCLGDTHLPGNDTANFIRVEMP